MLKMLALVGYGERAGSGLQGIFKTWTRVYHTEPEVDVSTGGVDRTTLSLNFGGNQPDIAAMRQLYDEPDQIEFREKVVEKPVNSSPQEGESSLKSSPIEGSSSPIEGDSSPIEGGSSPIGGDGSPTELIKTKEFTDMCTEDKVIALLNFNSKLSLTQLGELLAMTKRGVQKVINRLKEQNRLERTGSEKSGHWVVLK